MFESYALNLHVLYAIIMLQGGVSMLSIYPACFFYECNGYSIVFPDLNWLSTCGDTLEESMEKAVECLAGYLHTCQIDGEHIPEPSKLSDIDLQAIARELDLDAPTCESFVNMVSVDVASYAKEHFEKSVKKTLTIPAWLNKAALDKGINFSQVLQEALKEQLKLG